MNFDKKLMLFTGEADNEQALHQTMREAFARLTGSPDPIWSKRCYATESGLPHRLRLQLTADFQLRLVAANSQRVIAVCPLEAE